MKKVISTERLPIKLWADTVEENALKQAKNLANFPFAFKHISIMPDVHMGYGMPIGGVLATQEVVVPNAVGVDIACGVCAIRTPFEEIDKEQLKIIMGKIRKNIPVGFNRHKQDQEEKYMPDFENSCPIAEAQYRNALQQVGTLGGGNHFVEIQKGSDGYIWIMIHSGSRNLGFTVANHYNKLAIQYNRKWHSSVDPKWELAFLPLETEIAQNYIHEMTYCIDFAYANRKLMMDRVIDILLKELKPKKKFDDMINIAHNYAAMENHFGKNVLVHRKGATQAKEEQLGIIPGSQGTKSYIVTGKGNKDSFESCSHGAGRTMGRGQAKKELNLEKEREILDKQGIIHGMRHTNDLDEAPSAYKDIDKVMDNQVDLVNIEVQLTPLAVIKG